MDGVLGGSAPYAVWLTGEVGLGEWYDAVNPPVDVLTGDMLGVAVYASMLSLAEIVAHFSAWDGGSLGTRYCSPAVPNTTGLPGRLELSGSASVSSNMLTLNAYDLPSDRFAIFINSLALDLGQTPTPSGSVAVLAAETWYFQAWYRDWLPGQGPTTNLTDAVELQFQ